MSRRFSVSFGLEDEGIVSTSSSKARPEKGRVRNHRRKDLHAFLKTARRVRCRRRESCSPAPFALLSPPTPLLSLSPLPINSPPLSSHQGSHPHRPFSPPSADSRAPNDKIFLAIVTSLTATAHSAWGRGHTHPQKRFEKPTVRPALKMAYAANRRFFM